MLDTMSRSPSGNQVSQYGRPPVLGTGLDLTNICSSYNTSKAAETKEIKQAIRTVILPLTDRFYWFGFNEILS